MSCLHFSDGRVQRAIASVSVCVDACPGRVRLDRLTHSHARCDRLPSARERSGRDSCEERCAVCRALVDDTALEREVERGRDDLEPQAAPRASSRRPARRRRQRRDRAGARASRAARRRRPRGRRGRALPRSWRSERPVNEPVASGSACGVRSPWRYGRKVTPSAPASLAAASAVSPRTSRPGASASWNHWSAPAALSITPIASHVSGTAWQKACTRASRIVRVLGECREDDAGRPEDNGRDPGSTTPTPSAAACWSPAPAFSVDSATGGSHSRGISSAASTSSLQRLCATSKRSVPDASAASIAHSPVSR